MEWQQKEKWKQNAFYNDLILMHYADFDIDKTASF